MVEYLFISSVMNGIWRSLCNLKFETYHGKLVMVRSTFDWSLWIILVFDGLAHPHSWILCVQIGFNMHLYEYIKVLFSRESLDFRPKSHDICRTFKLSCWRFVLMCWHQVSWNIIKVLDPMHIVLSVQFCLWVSSSTSRWLHWLHRFTNQISVRLSSC
jgi:hypothetical protein